jgi:hypothetical protein
VNYSIITSNSLAYQPKRLDYDKTDVEQRGSTIQTRYKEHTNDNRRNEDKFSFLQHIPKKEQMCFTVKYTTQLDPKVYVKNTISMTSLKGSTF